MRSAASTSRCMSAEIACSVLNRKCGWSCCWSARQLRLGEHGFELRRAQRPAARFAVVDQGVAQADDRPVRDHFPIEVEQRRLLHFGPPGEPLARAGGDPPLDALHGRDVEERSRDHGREVNGERTQEPAALEPEALRQPDDGRRHQRPQVPVGVVQDGELLPGDVGPAEPVRELPGEAGRERTERRRHEQDERPADTPHDLGRAGTSVPSAVQIETAIRWRFHAVMTNGFAPGEAPPGAVYAIVRRKEQGFRLQGFAAALAARSATFSGATARPSIGAIRTCLPEFVPVFAESRDRARC